MKKIKLLCADADRTRLQGILGELRTLKVQVTEAGASLGKKDTVLTVLSDAFYADDALQKRLLDFVASGAEYVLPLQLDGSAVPEKLKEALYARNIIPAAGRDDKLIAERIEAAVPKTASPLPLILSLVGLALAVGIGLFLWKSAGAVTTPSETPVPAAAVEDLYKGELPSGITAEELASIKCAVIVGDHVKFYTEDERIRSSEFIGQWPDMLNELASENWDDDEAEWYWNEDGSRAEMRSYDLSFLGYMPNLEVLDLAMVDMHGTPDLSKSARLKSIRIMDCRLESTEWLGDSYVNWLQIRAHVDCAPLGRCRYLQSLTLDCYGDAPTDFSAFSPAELHDLNLSCQDMDSIDLSGLGLCKKLQRISLHGVPLRDLSFLEGNRSLDNLGLYNMPSLRDLSALSSCMLRQLRINSCPNIQDYSPLAACELINTLELWFNDTTALDSAFLANMTRLRTLELYRVQIHDLSFLEPIGEKLSMPFELSLTGLVEDYSALGAISEYEYLNIDTDVPLDFSLIQPYLQDIPIRELSLRRFASVDLSTLTNVSTSLLLDSCGIEDLSTMPADWQAGGFFLENCQNLRSLDGLQNQSKIGSGIGYLRVLNCPRLEDWSALDGLSLSSLHIRGCFTLPSFDKGLHVNTLRLENMPHVTDLDFLNGMDDLYACSFALVGMEGITNLAPLQRFHGTEIIVGPELEEEAAELVNRRKFTRYLIEYPEGGWEWERQSIQLNSLDELETLPKSLLRHVERLAVAGDQVSDPERFEIRGHWENNREVLYLYDRQTDEETRIQNGTISDISLLSDLSGLRELRLYSQPLQTLDGIQGFIELEEV